VLNSTRIISGIVKTILEEWRFALRHHRSMLALIFDITLSDDPAEAGTGRELGS